MVAQLPQHVATHVNWKSRSVLQITSGSPLLLLEMDQRYYSPVSDAKNALRCKRCVKRDREIEPCFAHLLWLRASLLTTPAEMQPKRQGFSL